MNVQNVMAVQVPQMVPLASLISPVIAQAMVQTILPQMETILLQMEARGKEGGATLTSYNTSLEQRIIERHYVIIIYIYMNFHSNMAAVLSTLLA